MADLIDGCLVVFRESAASGALAERLDSTGATIVAASEVAVPLVIQAIRHQLAEPASADGLADVVGRIAPADLATPTSAFRSGRYAPSGLRLVDQLLADADARSRAAAAIVQQSGLDAGSGAEMLSAAAWVVGAQLHHRSGSPPTAAAMAAALEGHDLAPSVPPRPAADPARAAVPAAEDAPLYRSVSPRPPARRDLPTVDSAMPGRNAGLAAPAGSDRPADPIDVPRPARPEHLMAAGPDRTTAPTVSRTRRAETPAETDEDIAVGSSGLVTGLAVLLLLLVAGFGAWWWLDRQEAESATSAELAEADSGDAEASSTEADAEAGDTDETGSADDGDAEAADSEADAADEGADGDEANGDPDDGAGADAPLPSLIGADGRAIINLSLADPVGRSEATATTDLTFDVNAEEVCYQVGLSGVAEPANGHIHLGPAGVKGGIIVDFGPMSDGLTGCEPVAAAEIGAILSDIDGHYVELHDPVEDFTVRAQIAEGFGADGQPVVGGGGAEAAADADDMQFDPDGGGAVALIESGRIVVYGIVADRQVAERVLVDFAGLADVVVIDELIVSEGAPPPSGRIIIDNPDGGLFATGSDVLDPEFDPLVDQLVGLLEARPSWVVTIVGHTDSTGDEVINLELSLARAEAVRTAMVEGGVEPDRVRVRGAGSTDPLASNDLPFGRDQNRRIEFEVQR